MLAGVMFCLLRALLPCHWAPAASGASRAGSSEDVLPGAALRLSGPCSQPQGSERPRDQAPLPLVPVHSVPCPDSAQGGGRSPTPGDREPRCVAPALSLSWRVSVLAPPPIAPPLSCQQTPLRLRFPWATFSRSVLSWGNRPPAVGLPLCAAFVADPQERRRLLTI